MAEPESIVGQTVSHYRVRSILEARWESAGKPLEGWIWSAPTRSGQIESSSLKKHHRQVFETVAAEAMKNSKVCPSRLSHFKGAVQV